MKKNLLSKLAIPALVATLFIPSYNYYQERTKLVESTNYSQTIEIKKQNYLEKIAETNNPQAPLSKKEREILGHINQVYTEIQKKETLPEYISQEYIFAIAKRESELKKNAKSPKGAKGIMQIMPRTWRAMGGKKGMYFNVKENLKIGTKYLNQLDTFCEKNHPNWDVLSPDERVKIISAAYNVGPTYLRKQNWNIEKMPKETKNYVKYISTQMGKKT